MAEKNKAQDSERFVCSDIYPIHFHDNILRYGKPGTPLFLNEKECSLAEKFLAELNGWEYFQAASFLDRVKNALLQVKLNIPADFVRKAQEQEEKDAKQNAPSIVFKTETEAEEE